MSEDARIEAAVKAYQDAWDHASYEQMSGDVVELANRDCMRAALEAADAVPGFTVVHTDDLRALLDEIDEWAVRYSRDHPYLEPDMRLVYDRLRVQVGETA